ncbi:hypothetical protein CFC21_050743 [Triticum aestivum]|uniref:Uncharacterized protein n=3 Tax=Triticinae TaxID=1648030 RepID=A0A452XVY7_AEGTS|nr:hypothetical protein CFC21_050743 [Triticum aestivum]
MPALPDAAVLAFYLADGFAKILVPLLCFLGSAGPSTRSPAVDDAAAFLLLLLPTVYLAGVILAHFVGVVLAHLHLATITAASAGPARLVALLFTLFSMLLLLIAVPFAAVYVFLGAGKRGTGPGFSENVLS